MKIGISGQFSIFLLLIVPNLLFAQGFQKYSEEVFRIKSTLDCSEEQDIPAIKDFGALYICTLGKAKTARWFISEKPKTENVQNIGLMWVDWKIDNGYGTRADWKVVEKALEYLIGLYVPSRGKELRKAFWDSNNEDFSTSDYMIYYTFREGPQKDERIVIIEEKSKQLPDCTYYPCFSIAISGERVTSLFFK